MITYTDPSAIMSVLLRDAPDHAELVELLLHGDGPVLTSELATVEVASACMAAERGGRVPDGRFVAEGFDRLCAPGGRIRLLDLRTAEVFAKACDLMEDHRLYALDAIHVAVALTEVVPLAAGEPVRFLTRDRTQAQAARALGFTVD
jgi:predicted nucleic acid-binding protein